MQNLPHRWLLFANGNPVGGVDPFTNYFGLALWLAVPLLTAAAALWRWRRPAGTTGPAAAFLGLGAFLSCLHFMYYDVLAAALPLCLLYAEPGRFVRSATARPPGYGDWPWNIAVMTLTALFFLLTHAAGAIDFMTNKGRSNMHSLPFDTFCLLGLWALCGWWWLRQRESRVSTDLDLSAWSSLHPGPGSDVVQVPPRPDEPRPIPTHDIRIPERET